MKSQTLAILLSPAWLLLFCVGCGDSKPHAECPEGETGCNGECFDLETDRYHCGACDRACDPEQTCDNGVCAGCQDECSAGDSRCATDDSAAFQTCGQNDTDSCLEWSDPQPCGNDQHCQDGECVDGCQDECPGSGERGCSGEGFIVCGEYDQTDDCLEWSPEQACPQGQICDPDTSGCREACGDFCDDFSVILLPDTQYYASKMADNPDNTYYKQMQWIIDNQEAMNIQFVIHLGDITNNNTLEQWTIADKAHAMLDAAGVPYSMVPGNHDYLTSGGFSRGATLYDDYFGSGRFAGQPWYGGSSDAANTSNYTFFEVGDLKFMVVSVEYAPRKEALCWAEEVIAAHPDHRVIVATHCYLTHNGAHAGNCPNSAYDVTGSDGATVWSELVSRHSNIFMVVSGHVGDSEYVPRTGNNANTVHQILVDYQFEAFCTAASHGACSDHCHAGTYTGNGWLRQMVFSPRSNQVQARTHTVEAGNRAVFPGGVPGFFCSLYNTTGHDWYHEEPGMPDHDYQFDYDLVSTDPYSRDDLASQSFSDLTVNSAGAGNQLDPSVALAADGTLVVAWEDDSDDSDGAGNHDILVRGFAAGGCERLADLVVNPDTAGQQRAPSAAMDQNGNFVVAWADDADGNGVFQIRARGFHADGSQRLAVFTVNTQPAGQQRNPATAMAPDGDFVVAWEDDQDGDGNYQILVRGFNVDGSELFADISANVNLEGQHLGQDLAMDSTGRFVAVWQDDSDGNGTYQIHARGFAPDGTERLPRFTVNTEAAGQQLDPALGMDAAGNFVVAWEDDQDGNGNFQVLARGFHADGSESFADMTVNTQAGGQQFAPAVSMAPDGRFAVAWEDDQDSNGKFQILARGFLSDGSEWFADTTINHDSDGDQLDACAALNSSGTLVVAWEDDMDENGYTQILARGLDGDAL